VHVSDQIRQKITFEQLAENRILHEVTVDLGVLKDMESMLHDRMHAYTLYFNAMGKNHYTMGPEQSRYIFIWTRILFKILLKYRNII
jgi:hypothetical protein